ncbi:MAG: deoxynucleoside kinase [Chloroflexi bacterium]|nr:deoxynucleoside kinase [Chloroflexota bacterium]MCH8338408.1 deoxynucleoside kinase [Chloroflexota bacterium]
MAKHFVLVSGNIGAGKTSLTRKLGARLEWETAYESVDDNPYLADFYADMRSWAFYLQIFFLGNRAQQHMALAKSEASAMIDRSIYEDAEIFARAALELGTVTDRDYSTYRQLFDLVVGLLPTPDLLIYLKAPVPELMRRIRARRRDMEGGVTEDYLALLEKYYEQWIERFDLCPTLTIRTDDLDFVHRPGHLDIVVDRIKDKLAGKEEIAFPQG